MINSNSIQQVRMRISPPAPTPQHHKPMRFRVEPLKATDCGYNCPNVVVADGVIEPDTPEAFIDFAKQAAQGSNLKSVLLINSPGGNVVAYDSSTGVPLWHSHIGNVTAPDPKTPAGNFTETATEPGANLNPTPGGESTGDVLLDYRSFKEQFEKEFIIKALKAFKGKINQTAMHANIPKKTLLRKLQKYKIRAEDYRE